MRLNEFLPYVDFKMETINSILTVITPDCYMVKVISRMLIHIFPFCQNIKNIWSFYFKENFISLPDGLSLGLREFNQLLKSPLAFLRKLLVAIAAYFDNLFACSLSFKKCEVKVKWCVKMLDSLGFIMHPENQFSS